MGRTVDLSNPSANGVTLKVVTYTSSIAGGLLGESVAGGKNILGDGSTDIIMGAPPPRSTVKPTPAPSCRFDFACSNNDLDSERQHTRRQRHSKRGLRRRKRG